MMTNGHQVKGCYATPAVGRARDTSRRVVVTSSAIDASRARVEAREMVDRRDVERALVSRDASVAYGADDDADADAWAHDVDADAVAARRARRAWRRTRGLGVMLVVACACACASGIGSVARGRTRAVKMMGAALGAGGWETPRVPDNFFGERLSADARAKAPSKAERWNRVSLRTRVPSVRTSGGRGIAARRAPPMGVPGLRAHVTRAQRASDDARILVLTKPFEWGMTYLQIASVKRWAPDLLPHVTVLTYDDETQKACEAHRGVDCFFDGNFVKRYGKDPNDGRARNAMSWRKVHAAYELLKAQIPVVILDSDTVFLSDPTEAWSAALEKYDVVVSSDVGNVYEAQGNMNTKLVIFPATTRSVTLCEQWLAGESRLVSKVNYGEFPEQSYFNYVLVPQSAGAYHIHAMSTSESSNFITADAGEDGTFPGAHTVTASYCGDARDKERFLQHVLETKHNAEAALGVGPRSNPSTAIPLSSATDFDHDGFADAESFPHPDLKCDHVKRRLVAQRRYEVTSDRHIVWT